MLASRTHVCTVSSCLSGCQLDPGHGPHTCLLSLAPVLPLLTAAPVTLQNIMTALADISIQLTAVGVSGTASLASVRAAPEFNPSNALFALIASGAASKPLTARLLLLLPVHDAVRHHASMSNARVSERHHVCRTHRTC